MTQRTKTSLRLFGLCLPLFLLTGCTGQKENTVSGTIVLPSKVKVEETDSIEIKFEPEAEAKAKSAGALVNAKYLTFTVNLPPGKYRVGVTVRPYAGMKDNAKRERELSQEIGKYSVQNSPIWYESPNEPTQSITVDFATGSVKKN